MSILFSLFNSSEDLLTIEYNANGLTYYEYSSNPSAVWQPSEGKMETPYPWYATVYK